jgi:MoaA/NifB/PqqE/SkfB family radical SAM enzyme
MKRYLKRKRSERLPRLPLEGSIDLTYRCNNDCRHCWLRLPADPAGGRRELSLEEIRGIAREARALGCRKWTISGGEPLLREDFVEIFEALTAGSAEPILVTNGTLITPALARLLKRPGAVYVSLYGATAAVHDGITRRPGSFEALQRGVSYLKEAGTAFTVQIVPMRSNKAQLEDMIRLADSWSPSRRFGASWLLLSADGDPGKNGRILSERLDPAEVVRIDNPGLAPGRFGKEEGPGGGPVEPGDGLFDRCLASRRDFHIDPWGGMSFCAFAKHPALRCDLRTTPFAEAWDERLPAMAGTLKAGPEYRDGCGSCGLRGDCLWCPVYAFLEHGNHSAKVEYLCGIARETQKLREERSTTHRRYYRIAGLTLRVDADLPITDATFHPKFESFRASGPGEEMLTVHHHFTLPDLRGTDLGLEVYRRPPWAIYRKDGTWIYLGIHPDPGDRRLTRVLVFDRGHRRGRIYHPSGELFLRGEMDSLLLLASDQVLLARVLPAFGGVFVHSAGVRLGGRGLLFAGPSEAGKSTIVKMLRDRADILCDDRMIVRRGGDGFRIHGTWSHGEVPEVSPDSAPLEALFFLRQSRENRLERISDSREAFKELLPRIIRPLATADWWRDVLSLAGEIARAVPFYNLHFDKSGDVVDRLEEMVR